ncbi:MAG: HlyD family efflux transporter periplasmic adaptor subunit [Bacteroidia bacterium]|nr:HlyD family efflux transporter periplasmic adaptor subunit [Bacteroidia bacterium]
MHNMKTRLSLIQTGVITLLMLGCNKEKEADASGMFEAVETIVSAEAQGRILNFNVNEGDELRAGQSIGYIDSTQAYLNKLQLLQQQKAILSAKPSVQTQLEAFRAELRTAESDQARIQNLVSGDIASQKQLADANSRVEVLRSKIAAQESVLNTTNSSITENAATVNIQLALAEQALLKCRIINPVKGVVLAKYAEVNEVTGPGKPLYKIADLSFITLKAYVSGNQLEAIQLNQEVTVLVDDPNTKQRGVPGKITWISNKGEFTPKTIQTKNERDNTVYAIKVMVKNDGSLKLGMYAEVRF